MPDFSKPRHSAKVIAACLDESANLCRFFAHPFSTDGSPVDQPTPEESDELDAKADEYAAGAQFWRDIAPDLPRDSDDDDVDDPELH